MDSVPRGKRSNREMRGLGTHVSEGFHFDIAPWDLSRDFPQRCPNPQAASVYPTSPSSTTSGPCYCKRSPLETPVTTPGSPCRASLSPEPKKEPAGYERPFAIQFLEAGWLPITTSPPGESLLSLETEKFSESRFSFEDWDNLPCLQRARSAASRRGTVDILDSEIVLFIRALCVLGCGLYHEILGKGFHDH